MLQQLCMASRRPSSLCVLFASLLLSGQPVAKLPFEPFGFVQSMSHRGLGGSDVTDCRMTFIYVLCSISIRAHVQKALGWSPVQAGPSMFQMPEQK